MKEPTFDEFTEYAQIHLERMNDNNDYSEWLYLKFMAWSEDDWHKSPGGKRQKIKNWKSTLLQCLKYREPNKVKKLKVNEPKTITERLING